MLALEKDGSLVFQGSWNKKIQSMTGLLGNQQPKLPFETSAGTLRDVTYLRPTLKEYEQEGGETGRLNGSVWQITVSAKEINITSAKQKALGEIAAKRFEVETGGVVGNGKFYATDRHSQAAIFRSTGTVSWKAAATVSRDIEQADGSKVATICISEVEFVDTDMVALQAIVKTHIDNAYAREKALMSAIDSASDIAALRSIDLTSGWASIPQNDPGA